MVLVVFLVTLVSRPTRSLSHSHCSHLGCSELNAQRVRRLLRDFGPLCACLGRVLQPPPLLGSFCIFASGMLAREDAGLPRAWRRAADPRDSCDPEMFSRAVLGFALAVAIRASYATGNPRARRVAIGCTLGAFLVVVALTVGKIYVDPSQPSPVRVHGISDRGQSAVVRNRHVARDARLASSAWYRARIIAGHFRRQAVSGALHPAGCRSHRGHPGAHHALGSSRRPVAATASPHGHCHLEHLGRPGHRCSGPERRALSACLDSARPVPRGPTRA